MEQIKDEPATVEYVHNFLTNREEKGLCFIYKYTFIFDLKTALSIFMP